ncbi:GNAT family N-acetyltransferase [Rubrivirga sp.]|uniref:GNAT family N-acetyltransferase n=1 Tax=Rubrivirga sp. TaxID=1885344 RepID=UPI003B5249E9
MSAFVRLARPSDLAPALALWTALHREHQALDPRYRLADDAAARWSTDFRDWTRSEGSRVWLALDAGRPVGLLTAHLYQPAPLYREHLLVHVADLYVMPEARGVGTGRALLDHARSWGRAEGAAQLQAGVLAANAAGRAFWARAGADDYSVTVTVGLGDAVDKGGARR